MHVCAGGACMCLMIMFLSVIPDHMFSAWLIVIGNMWGLYKLLRKHVGLNTLIMLSHIINFCVNYLFIYYTMYTKVFAIQYTGLHRL